MLRGLAISSAIFAAGSFGAKFAKLLLIPVYVRYLTPAEVGLVVFLEALMLAGSRFFPMGLGQAVKRFYYDFPDRQDADAYSRMLWVVTLGFGVVGVGLLGSAAFAFPTLFSANVSASLIFLALCAGALRSAHAIPMQRFIARREPTSHSTIEVLEIASTVALIMAFVMIMGWGVQGVLLGHIISYSAWVAVYALILNRSAAKAWPAERLPAALKYALPLWPHLFLPGR